MSSAWLNLNKPIYKLGSKRRKFKVCVCCQTNFVKSNNGKFCSNCRLYTRLYSKNHNVKLQNLRKTLEREKNRGVLV